MGVAEMTKSQEDLLLDVYASLMDTWAEVPKAIRESMFHNSKEFFAGRMFGMLIDEIKEQRN